MSSDTESSQSSDEHEPTQYQADSDLDQVTASESESDDEQITDVASDSKQKTSTRKGRLEPRRQLDPSLLQEKQPQASSSKSRQKPQKRSNKHAPTEVSSKKAVGRLRTIIETPKDTTRDPRFSNLSGEYDPKAFNASYSFLDEQRQSELATLKKTVQQARKTNNLSKDEKDKLERALKRLESVQSRREREKREQEVISSWKKQENDQRKTGKGVYHLKSAEKKKMFLEDKMDKLSKDKKKLNKYTDKQRKKTAAKDRKMAPPSRA